MNPPSLVRDAASAEHVSPVSWGAGGGDSLLMKADKTNYWGYNKSLRPRASKLRHSMTKAEVYLWKFVLRASGVKGYPFRRQRPVLEYIADFMCKNLNLIIEVDGESHSWPGVPERDAIRQKRLEEAGFRVIRFTNEEVLSDLDGVAKRIEIVIGEIERAGGVVIPPWRGKPPPPAPPR